MKQIGTPTSKWENVALIITIVIVSMLHYIGLI